ncbi:MmgE/PrpD family protein [Muricoccus nepalensis]|uniref:MmgE/PrpD family protein n=1 Tax=Muricoccus nepalensis TaxID=1854500 RepID=UPI001386B796|nr:MmgE/PrpD family protein [Roseomonas nepalensis]
MASDFIARLSAAVRGSEAGDAAHRDLLGRAIADTVGVAAAGWGEPAVRAALSAYRGGSARSWSGEALEGEDAAVMIDAIAAHALDFDDVYLDSATHPSAVILPAILRADRHDDPAEILAAFAAGLTAALAVARRLGAGHYHRGWHGTGTIGAFAAAAAAGRLRRLDERQLASAFALAAAQSGGLRANFGTMAKPAQAGLAAAAGVRAARLAAAGLQGSPDIFAPGGYADLYGAADGAADPGEDAFRSRPDLLALKLYPCCYASHRLIGLALDARAALGAGVAEGATRFRVLAPRRSLEVLRHDRPANGLEAKFSGPYAIAAALLDGPPGLRHFDGTAPAAATRPLLDRIELSDASALDSGGDITAGEVTMEVLDSAGAPVARFARRAIPGSPEDPPTRAAVAAKLAGCLAVFEKGFGRPFPLLPKVLAMPEVAAWLAPAEAAPRGRPGTDAPDAHPLRQWAGS